jgi:hypothetical protein
MAPCRWRLERVRSLKASAGRPGSGYRHRDEAGSCAEKLLFFDGGFAVPELRALLPRAADVLRLSREQIASYLLEALNSDPNLASGERSQHVGNYVRAAEEWYGDRDAADRVASAWQWCVEREYLTRDFREPSDGWFRLTPNGREVRHHDDLQVPRVPRALNPGPPPDFSPVTPDGVLRKHLWVLWEEAVMATNGGAHLAAVIMLGSLMEGALLGKCMKEDTQAHAALSAPRRNGAVQPWERWSLNDFINVAGECGWIRETREQFSHVLREYRNMVHPYASYATGYRADEGLVRICWEIVRAAVGDLGVKLGAESDLT